MNVKIDRKEGVATLLCRVCGQRFQGKVNREHKISLDWITMLIYDAKDLTEPIDIYSEWIDAADAAQNDAGDEEDYQRPTLSRTKSQRAEASDDEEGDGEGEDES